MSESSHTRFHVFLAALLAVLIGLFAAGCGGDEPTGEGDTPPNYSKLTNDSPLPLKALYEEGNELIDGGQDSFDSQMLELRGYPAVINIWASWCGPCRAEFPHFQDAAARFGQKVAFVGVNSSDDDELAQKFLDDNPVPYPSFSDPDAEVKDSLDATRGFPATAFFDSEGRRTFTKIGQYATLEDLEADVQTYAIKGGGR